MHGAVQQSNTFYDAEVTRIVPVVTIAKSNGPASSEGWVDSRVFCLSTPNITEGSRKPASVPSAGERLQLNVVGSMLMILLMAWTMLY
jgi:hypothetical protein